MRILRLLSFGSAGVLVCALMAATVVEQVCDTDTALRAVYHAPWFVALWGVTAVAGLGWLMGRLPRRRWAVWLWHASLVIILLGALATHVWGRQGNIHLRAGGEPVQVFTDAEGQETALPFRVGLEDFQVEYYPGTHSPMDYVSRIVIVDAGDTLRGQVSMNRIYAHRHYRFYQSSYDEDGRGTVLAVSHDPLGIAVTYAGYVLLLAAVVSFFCSPSTGFRALLRHPLLRRGAVAVMLFAGCLPVSLRAAERPAVLPAEVAAAFGELHVYYNGRICPLQTLARDFTLKLCGRASYRGFTPEQVLTGWFFFYDDWKAEPCIRIPRGEARRLLGVEGSHASLSDFVGPEGYKLGKSGASVAKGVREADEKFQLVSMVATGNMLKLYPVRDAEEGRVSWLSMVDDRPEGIESSQWLFVRKSLGLVAEQIALGDYRKACELLAKIRAYQVKEAGHVLPSPLRFRAEKVYNRMNYSRPFAFACLAVGLCAFAFCVRCLVRQSVPGGLLFSRLLTLGLWLIAVYLAATIILRGYVSHHVPLSNGYETMQFMAFATVSVTLLLRRRYPMLVAFGYLLCGLSLLVAMMGEANPPITRLMPVLSSPLLSAHVVTIMVAYSLLAFMMLGGVTGIILHYARGGHALQVERLSLLSRLLAYPAVACLAVGIFIGAVWANVSWGRYWGWDPKEVWALITLLIYAAALHPASLPALRRPMFFHWFTVIAFLSVLVTYFGVNFLMGGMHSYA